MALNIFLTADVHLGMKFSSYPEAREELAEVRFKTLENCISTANEKKCGLFIVAGDLFDRVTTAKSTIVRAAGILAGFEGNCICILPGNHDYYSSGKDELWALIKESSGDRLEILTEKREYPLDHYDLETTLYPAPCTAKTSGNNSISWIKRSGNEDGKRLHIGIAHGSLEGFSPDFDKRYYPMTRNELFSCGLDLWLLGHTHTQYPGEQATGDRIFYPGTPEPDGFDCSHEGKAWMITVDDEKNIRPSSISTGTYRFIHESIELQNPSDLESLRTRYSPADRERTLLKMQLTGSLPKDVYKDLLPIITGMEKELFYLFRPVDTTDLREEITPDDIHAEFTEGSFPYRLLSELSKEKDSLALQLAYDLIREVKNDH